MNLDDLSDFCLVASNGGFAQASRTGGRPKASLSRKVMDLEASLGVRLFERSSRSVHLTEEGELLFKSTAGPLNEIAEAVDMLRDGRAHAQGRLRVNVRPSALPRKRTPCGRMQAPLPVLFMERMMCRR